MRSYLIRPVLAAVLFVAVASVPAIAQPLVRGRVVDTAGKPVPDATIEFVAKFQSLSRSAKTEYPLLGIR